MFDIVAWEINLGLPISITPVLDDTEEILYVAVSGSASLNTIETSQIYAINSTDGTLFWNNPWTPPIIASTMNNNILQNTAITIISDLRYIAPNILLITAMTSTNINIVYAINTNLTMINYPLTANTQSIPPLSNSPNILWNCLTIAPIHQPITTWAPWRLMTTATSTSTYEDPTSMDWLGYGSIYMVSDDGTVYGIDLDSNDPLSCPIVGRPSSSGSLSSVTCEACSTWVLQRGNRLLGRITSGPVIHPITSKDVTPSPVTNIAPISSSNNINITTTIVSARLFIATSAASGYSGGIYVFNLTAGGTPPLPTLPSLSLMYNPSYVRDSKQLIYSVTGVSYSVSPTPLLIFPQSSTFSSSPYFIPWSEWLIIGTSLGEVICLDVSINNTETSLISPVLGHTASLVWWTRIPPLSNPVPITAGPIYDGASTMVGVGDGSIVNIDVRTGNFIWSISTTAGAIVPISHGGMIVDNNGKVYSTNANGFLVTLDDNCPVAPHEVIYISIAVTGTILCSIIMLYYCIQAEKARRRIGIHGPTREFIDSILRIAGSVPEWSRRIGSSLNRPATNPQYPFHHGFPSTTSFRSTTSYLPLGGRVRRRSRTSTGASVDLSSINHNTTNVAITIPEVSEREKETSTVPTILELPNASELLKQTSKNDLSLSKPASINTQSNDTLSNSKKVIQESSSLSQSISNTNTLPVSRSRSTSLSNHLPFTNIFSSRSRTGSDGMTMNQTNGLTSTTNTTTATILGNAAAKLLDQSNTTFEEIQTFPRGTGKRGGYYDITSTKPSINSTRISNTIPSNILATSVTSNASLFSSSSTRSSTNPRLRLPIRADPSFSELDHISIDDLLTPRDNINDPSSMIVLQKTHNPVGKKEGFSMNLPKSNHNTSNSQFSSTTTTTSTGNGSILPKLPGSNTFTSIFQRSRVPSEDESKLLSDNTIPNTPITKHTNGSINESNNDNYQPPLISSVPIHSEHIKEWSNNTNNQSRSRSGTDPTVTIHNPLSISSTTKPELTSTLIPSLSTNTSTISINNKPKSTHQRFPTADI